MSNMIWPLKVIFLVSGQFARTVEARFHLGISKMVLALQ